MFNTGKTSFGPQWDTATTVEHIRTLGAECHRRAVANGWWNDMRTGESMIGRRNVGEMLMLITSEIAEVGDGLDEGCMDDKLPQHPMYVVELADTVIRITDLDGSLGLDIAGAVGVILKNEQPAINVAAKPGQVYMVDQLFLMMRWVAAAMESHRKKMKPDDLYPDRTGIAIGLARTVIMAFLLAEYAGYNLNEIILDKLDYNDIRPDHKLANRREAGGKTY